METKIPYERIARNMLRDALPKGEESLLCFKHNDVDLPSGIYIFGNYGTGTRDENIYYHLGKEWSDVSVEKIGDFVFNVWPKWKLGHLNKLILPGYKVISNNGDGDPSRIEYFVNTADKYIYIGNSFRDVANFLRVGCSGEIIELIYALSNSQCLKDGIVSLSGLQSKVHKTRIANNVMKNHCWGYSTKPN